MQINALLRQVYHRVTSSINVTINKATGVSQHYTITGRHSNISLPKLHKKEIANDDPGAYGMQINALLRQVYHRVTSSINVTINKATGVSQHYTITGRHSNISLPKLHKKEIANDDPGAYGMQINALLRQVHHCVTLANDEADHRMGASLNYLIYKDPIQVSGKVLIHRPQSIMAQSSDLDRKIYSRRNKHDESAGKQKW